MADKTRKDKLQVLLCLEAVMKNHDGTGTCGLHCALQAFLGRKALRVVVREDVPHDYPIIMECLDLTAGDSAIGRTEKRGRWLLAAGRWLKWPGLNQALAAFYIVKVDLGAGLPAAEVVESVIANSVAGSSYFPKYGGVF